MHPRRKAAGVWEAMQCMQRALAVMPLLLPAAPIAHVAAATGPPYAHAGPMRLTRAGLGAATASQL